MITAGDKAAAEDNILAGHPTDHPIRRQLDTGSPGNCSPGNRPVLGNRRNQPRRRSSLEVQQQPFHQLSLSSLPLPYRIKLILNAV